LKDTILNDKAVRDLLVTGQGHQQNYQGKNLRDANLEKADLGGADFAGADLRGAVLKDADLTGANLTRTQALGADLEKADLGGADFTGADLRACLSKPRQSFFSAGGELTRPCLVDISSMSNQGRTARRRGPLMRQSRGMKIRRVMPIQHGRPHSPLTEIKL
jgi:uncharacterized protein YjbI with pentapeptide repeats